jgi:hypothetical protein
MRRYGDWTEQSLDYCNRSGMTLDLIISTMLEAGLELRDIRNLEYLADNYILKRIPLEKRELRHNKKEDVITYMNAWAELLEEKVAKSISLETLTKEKTEEDSFTQKQLNLV